LPIAVYGLAKRIASLARKCEEMQGISVVGVGKTVDYRFR
jgi:hypothetical protein